MHLSTKMVTKWGVYIDGFIQKREREREKVARMSSQINDFKSYIFYLHMTFIRILYHKNKKMRISVQQKWILITV